MLLFTYHVEQLDAGQLRLGMAKRCESQHLSYPTFDITVILLNPDVQILALPDGDVFLICRILFGGQKIVFKMVRKQFHT